MQLTGDKTHEWIKFANKWKRDHPPQDNGCYLCGICGKWCLADEVVLDHIVPRSAAPNRVFDATNIQPAHYMCNAKKGSRKIAPVVDRTVYVFLDWMNDL